MHRRAPWATARVCAGLGPCQRSAASGAAGEALWLDARVNAYAQPHRMAATPGAGFEPKFDRAERPRRAAKLAQIHRADGALRTAPASPPLGGGARAQRVVQPIAQLLA